MFGFFKKKDTALVLGAPAAGQAVPAADIPDPTFGEEILGKCIAVRPTEGRVYAPCDADVSMVFDTKHAVTLQAAKGVEILIHVGLETVSLEGKPFRVVVKDGDQVKKGDLLMEADLEMIKAAGLETIIPMVICNSDDYKSIRPITGKTVAVGNPVMEIE